MKIRYLIGMAMILVLIAAMFTGCAKKEEVEEEQPVVVEEPTEGQLVEKTEEPAEEEKCGVDTVLTYMKCVKQADNKIAVTLKNTGRGVIEGAWVYVSSKDGNMGYEEVKEEIAIMEEKTYEIDLAKWEGKLGDVERVEIGPEDLINGAAKVCINQKQVFFPEKNCK